MSTLVSYAVLWFLASFLLALLISQVVMLPLSAVEYGLIGLLLGLLGLVPIISTERGRRLFYDGPEPDEDGDPLIGCLWTIPIQGVLLALLGWLVWLIIYLIGRPRR